MLNSHKRTVYAISSLIICSTNVPFQSVQAEDPISTISSIKQAPFSKLFYTGSTYAVKDHDYKGREQKMGVSTLWSKNPANGNLSLGVRYCVPSDTLTSSAASLTRLVLFSNNQQLVAIDKPIQTTSSYQRVVQFTSVVPGLGFWHPDAYLGKDASWDSVDQPFWSDAAELPSVTCSAGSGLFDIAPLANTIAQLPNQTLQMKLIFSNGETSEWRLGKKTVQALKDLLNVRQTSLNSSQAPSK